MDSFEGRIAVVTGGGTGMGRELVVQLAAEGCHVATCDVNPETLDETADTKVLMPRADGAGDSRADEGRTLVETAPGRAADRSRSTLRLARDAAVATIPFWRALLRGAWFLVRTGAVQGFRAARFLYRAARGRAGRPDAAGDEPLSAGGSAVGGASRGPSAASVAA